MVGTEKSNKLSNTEIISKGSFVAAIITVPTLASFFGVWQVSDNLLYGAVAGLIVNFVAIGFPLGPICPAYKFSLKGIASP